MQGPGDDAIVRKSKSLSLAVATTTRGLVLRIPALFALSAAWILGSILFLAVAAESFAGAGATRPLVVAVIVHPNQGIDSVSTQELRAVYLGQSQSLGRQFISAYHLSSQFPARTLFQRTVIGKDSAELRTYWIDLKLQNPSVMEPRVFHNAKALVSLVAREPGAVAYVPLEAIRGSPVRVLKIDGVAPPASADPSGVRGYPLME